MLRGEEDESSPPDSSKMRVNEGEYNHSRADQPTTIMDDILSHHAPIAFSLSLKLEEQFFTLPEEEPTLAIRKHSISPVAIPLKVNTHFSQNQRPLYCLFMQHI